MSCRLKAACAVGPPNKHALRHRCEGFPEHGDFGNITFRAVIVEQIVFGDLRLILQKSPKISGELRRARRWWAHLVCAGSPPPLPGDWQGVGPCLPIGVPLKVARLVPVRSQAEQRSAAGARSPQMSRWDLRIAKGQRRTRQPAAFTGHQGRKPR